MFNTAFDPLSAYVCQMYAYMLLWVAQLSYVWRRTKLLWFATPTVHKSYHLLRPLVFECAAFEFKSQSELC